MREKNTVHKPNEPPKTYPFVIGLESLVYLVTEDRNRNYDTQNCQHQQNVS